LKKTVVIAAAVLLALLAAAGILIANKKDSTPDSGKEQSNVRIIENSTQESNPADEALLDQIAELRAQVEKLEKEKGQENDQKQGEPDFDSTAYESELNKLQKRIAELEEQNRYLRDRNSELSDKEAHLEGLLAIRDGEIASRSHELNSRDQLIAALNNKIGELTDKIINDDDAYYRALDTIAELRESLRRKDAVLASAETTGTLHVTKGGELVNTFSVLPPGQSRNSFDLRFGNRNINMDGSIAIMPHWFLLASLGIDQVHDDFVKEEFPGYDADNAFFYDVLMGTGLNWRFNRIQSQPNFYINTAVGPAWFLYKQDGEVELKTYFLWRSSVGFDLTLHKHLQFTGDIGVDWVQNYGFSPRFSLGVLWSFSHDWNIMGKK
jgi:hypothetical protein